MGRKLAILIDSARIGCSILALLVFFMVAFSRIAYPYSIEWVEANTFLHVARVLEGKPIYVPPSYDFIPMIYTPLYYYLAAGFTSITGQIMFSMRLLSILAFILCLVMIYALCRLRGHSIPSGLSALGLFAASYAVTGFWYDVGRVDTLALAFLLTGYLLGLAKSGGESLASILAGTPAGLLAGLFLFLAFWTKQSMVVGVPFLILYLVLNRRYQKALWLGITFVLLAGISFFIANTHSSGWFSLYVFDIPAAHPLSWRVLLLGFWALSILPNYLWLLLAILLALLALAKSHDRAPLLDVAAFGISFLVPFLIVSASSIAKQWGYINALLPTAAAFAVMGSEAFHLVSTGRAYGDHPAPVNKKLYLLVGALIILQFFSLRYDFRAQIPANASVESGNRTLELLRGSRDPVFIPTSPYLLSMIGRETHFHNSSLGDLNLAASHDPEIRARIHGYLEAIPAYLSSGSIQTVILPNAGWYDAVFSEENGYRCESLVADQPPLRTLTGAISSLERICRLKDSPAP